MINEKKITKVMLTISTVSLVIGVVYIVSSLQNRYQGLGTSEILQLLLFCFALSSLFFGNVTYQLTRIGQLTRHEAHDVKEAATPSDLRFIYKYDSPPPVMILIPSYKEELSIIVQTVLSAALAEYPDRCIALLIDDPPVCDGEDKTALLAARETIARLNKSFKKRADFFSAAKNNFEQRAKQGGVTLDQEISCLEALYDRAAGFVEDIGTEYRTIATAAFAHSDDLFYRDIIQRIVNAHRAYMTEHKVDILDEKALRQEYARLQSLFKVSITSFERKLYRNLSHAANKAMNLNSYIGLIGNNLSVVSGADGSLELHKTTQGDAGLSVPMVKYVLTIDADSVILPDYILKLVKIMEENDSIAVAQTPYSAFQNPPTVLERVAGATTDIQYLVHQGFTAYNATFWVGANALLRFAALQDIQTMQQERGYAMPIFIQDRTVIEDTGSTMDLISRGWRLHNHPQRLAYSATPSDFGSLVIQRRRWANGGLIIFPRLLKLKFGRTKHPVSFIEAMVRSYYLLSPALTNIGLLILLLFPFSSEYSNPFLVLAAAPYYFLYARDLRKAGYNGWDLLRHYALTLLLIPVNLAGVYHSLIQVVTSRRRPFGRTPKVSGRTAVPIGYIIFIYALSAIAAASAVFNLLSSNYLFFLFCSINAGFLIYGQKHLLGWKETAADIQMSFADWYDRRGRKAPDASA